MPEENSATGGAPEVPAPAQRRQPEPEPESGFIICRACDSKLHKSGDVKKKSDSLNDLEKAAEKSNEWKSKYEAVKAELDALRNSAAPAPEPSQKKHLHLARD